MALIFTDGADTGDAAYKWTAVGGATLSSSATTRFSSGRSLAVSGVVVSGYAKRLFAASSQVYVGAAWYVYQLAGSLNILTLYGDGGTTAHLALNTSASGQIILKRGSTTIATSVATGLVAANRWDYVEMSATISDTVGTAVVRVNNVEVINFTGDTKEGGTNTTVDAIAFSCSNISGTPTSLYDDIYVCDGTGSAPANVFLGDVRVQTLLPTGAGTSTQWTPSVGNNWDNVNDAPLSVATYNSASVSGYRDTYAMSDLNATTVTVFGVQTNLIASKSDAGTGVLKAAIRSGGTDYYDADQNLSTSWASFLAMRETDPATAAAWTPTNVNALEFGAEVV